MDTKSRKSSKTAKIIIALTVILPALILVCLYPRMEKVMLNLREMYEHKLAENTIQQDETDIGATYSSQEMPSDADMYSVQENFINYAVEASYYLYGKLLQEAEQREINFEVLDYYGWINDFYTLEAAAGYYVQYEPDIVYEAGNRDQLFEPVFSGEKLPESYFQSLRENDVCGYLTMEFDRYGKLSGIEFKNLSNLEYDVNLYKVAKISVEQYDRNARYYTNPDDEEGEQFVFALQNALEVVPKNFKAVFALTENSIFIDGYNNIMSDEYAGIYWYYYDPVNLYLEIGSIWIIIILAMVVAAVALILPFFKRLNTGWEKLFCMPVELIVCIAGMGLGGAYLMFEIMCHSTFIEVEQLWGHAQILGYPIEDRTVYYVVLFLNFLGWASLFFLEYISVAGIRQFLCHPVMYLKNRLLGVIFLRWLGRQCKRFLRFMTEIELTENLRKSILKIVCLNFMLVALCCCGWFAGILGAVIYSVVLYGILCKKGKQVLEQYDQVFRAAGQMAAGELKISLSEDLGIFAPLGRELEQVQVGFAKAVAEEAKSQSMKTELISNVSHDLKTPLTAIITYVNLLKQPDNTPEQQQNYIQTLDMKSQRLKVLIEDLFEVSKAQSGNIQLELMDVDVVSLMKQIRLEMEDKIADSDLVFRWNLPEEKVILPLDGEKTYRILENLLSNALKYALPNSRVYVDVISTEQEVQIVFKNISAIELNVEGERLTERFVRGDTSRNSEGSGLGLAIVKSFTQLQGGTFKIDIDGDLFKAILIWKK